MAVGRMQFCVLQMAAYVLTTMLWKLHDAISTDRIIYCQMEGRLGCVPTSKYRQMNWQWPIKNPSVVPLSWPLLADRDLHCASSNSEAMF
jgi:hypothetical protein